MNTLQNRIETLVFEELQESMLRMLEAAEYHNKIRPYEADLPLQHQILRNAVYINPGRCTGKSTFVAKNFNHKDDLLILPSSLMRNQMLDLLGIRNKFTEAQEQKIITPDTNVTGRRYSVARIWMDEPSLGRGSNVDKFFWDKVFHTLERNTRSVPQLIVVGA